MPIKTILLIILKINQTLTKRIYLQAGGAEKLRNLNHNIKLSPAKSNEIFNFNKRGNGYTIDKEGNKYLSHAFARLWYQNGYRGLGELWYRENRDGGFALRAAGEKE